MRELVERLREVLRREGLAEFMRKADWEYCFLRAEKDEALRNILQTMCIKLVGEAVDMYSKFRERMGGEG